MVEHLSRYLERSGMDTWYAPRDIRAGGAWPEAIHEAIRSCSAVVLLFCQKADESMEVERELSLASRYKKPVFWLRLERVEPDKLGYFLTMAQWLDWLDMRDDTLEKLVRDLKATTERGERVLAGPEGGSAWDMDQSWAKGLLTFASERDAAECAARVYFTMGQRRPDSSLVLPTGRSATVLFRAMLRIAGEYEGCPFGQAQLLSDTETFGVWQEHESSRTRHIRDSLLRPLEQRGQAPAPEQLHLLSGIYMQEDPVKAAERTLRAWPPAVHGLSVSPTGEMLGYEVGTYNDMDEILDDTPRVVEIGERGKKYIDPNQPSRSILTLGIGSMLASEVLLVLLFDAQKAPILKRLFTGPMTAGIPATLLRRHPNAYILTTSRIARDAELDGLCRPQTDPKEAARWILDR